MMNTLSRALACLVFASLTVITVTEAHSAGDTRSDGNGTISLAEKSDGSGDTCKIAVKTEKVDLGDEPNGCTHDEMSYIKFENVLSAVVVELESRGCDEEGGWVFVLKTYKARTSTGWISIRDLEGQPKNHIVTAGVRKIDGWNEDEDSTDSKLSCVDIRVSEPDV